MHPVELADEDAFGVFELWRHYRPSGLGGPGHLPFAGGAADQPALLLDAFAVLAACEAALMPKKSNSSP